jgi:hypothetical protein
MEITDARQIEIFHTLEKIERMNKAVAFHKAIDNPDKLAIEQYKQMKRQLSTQLVQLLAEMDLELKLVAA